MEIQSGAGGTDAMDFVARLLRMYSRWAQRKGEIDCRNLQRNSNNVLCFALGYEIDVIDETHGDVAGVKNVTLKIDGHHAYGKEKREG
jgi:peptide chain release factor 2